MGETAIRRSEAQVWWGEAPERLLVFSKSLVTFGDIIRKADSLPSRWPSAMQSKSVGIGRPFLEVENHGRRLGSLSAQVAFGGASSTCLARRLSPCKSLAPPSVIPVCPITDYFSLVVPRSCTAPYRLLLGCCFCKSPFVSPQ